VARGANADADLIEAIFHAEAAAAQAKQGVSKLKQALASGGCHQQDRELVTGKSRKRRLGIRMGLAVLIERALGTQGKDPQQRITGVMAMLIVDLLEVVQVNEQQRQLLAALF